MSKAVLNIKIPLENVKSRALEITQNPQRLLESGLLDDCALEILRRAQDDTLAWASSRHHACRDGRDPSLRSG